ncbi:TetR/AcrR family transcriptional regulator [Nocardia yamanashiensis]|uniref:TetR/AcrR family transcriptional regulator n=1 Tax=Nocardia yamanashiensis TaxID=209247 RepID=UPI001E2DA719|nr:TetR/AcrR family transcriptional regulator [Nocardia yamanashiensis]UGT44032.1 TetR/AcrR family transcriptional regulator [Nocardia yamanashiensis]
MSDRQTQILEAAIRVIAQDGVRGLRIEKLAAEAGVSTALIYYHFKDRAGVLHAALGFINAQAERYTDDAFAHANPRAALEQSLLLEIQDSPDVRNNSIAWGELRASAVFSEELREQLRETTRVWVDDVAELITRARDAGHAAADLDPVAAADRLTALVEGLSERWLSGSLTAERARELLSGAIVTELGRN